MPERARLATLAAELWFVSRAGRAAMSKRIVAVLTAMNTTPPREMSALDICRSAGLPAGAVDPTLLRLEDLGWAVSRREAADPRRGRARRRVYKLTAEGVRRASQHGRVPVVVHNEGKGSRHG